jgi:hypothetical protein
MEDGAMFQVLNSEKKFKMAFSGRLTGVFVFL